MTAYFDFSAKSVAALAQADVARALLEDVAEADLTAGLVDPTRRARATVVARESAVICGAPWVERAFKELDPTVELTWCIPEGHRSEADQVVLEVRGQARAMLTAERTALNFLQLLSAVATKTANFVQAVREVPGARTHIVDTRKTLPGLRLAQKYAVHTGGGINHRLGLYDAVLIKENHIAAAGGVRAVLERAAEVAPQARFVEIEVESLEQLQQALDAGATMILLDNMDLEQMCEAVAINAGRAELEASGGVRLDTVRAIAETGVNRISIGGLTKDVRAIDLSLRHTEQ